MANVNTAKTHIPSLFNAISKDKVISTAPMLDWTDMHYRYFIRMLTKRTVLYTEMITSGAILYGHNNYLEYNEEEHPLVLQLGGSDPKDLAKCAKLAKDYNYDGINLNVGCPSNRVQNGSFGACLMNSPDLVAICIKEMQDNFGSNVTVKTRIGVDDNDSYEFLANFIDIIAKAGCKTFIVHARKAWLKGLSPKQNRTIPPLNYERVYKLKQDFPYLNIEINGGVVSLQEATTHLSAVDGVMFGRSAYHNPYLLSDIDSLIYGDNYKISRDDALFALFPYIEKHIQSGGKLHHIARHILGLYHEQPNGSLWRRYISENAFKEGAGVHTLESAYKKMKISS